MCDLLSLKMGSEKRTLIPVLGPDFFMFLRKPGGQFLGVQMLLKLQYL